MGVVSVGDVYCVVMVIVNLLLVKIVIVGEDVNWGCVVMVVGKFGVQVDCDKLIICFGDMVLVENGWCVFSYDEVVVSVYMKCDYLVVGVDLGMGCGKCMVWICDLMYGYIDINVDYCL